MKKFFVAIVISLFFAAPIFAQNTEKEEMDAFQANFGKEKKLLVADLIKMTPEQNKKFWPIYDTYETERKAIGKERLQLIKDLSDAYNSMTDAKADAVTTKAMMLSKNTDKLLEKYYNQMKKEVGSEVAFEFYQAEVYIQTSVKNTLMEEIPLYGHVRKAK